jgi:hypothetical protein
MRYIAIVLLVACGSGQPAPVESVESRVVRQEARRAANIDAGVAPADATAASDEQFRSVTEARQTTVEPVKPEPEPEVSEPAEPELPENVTIEDGVAVIRTNQRAWCGALTCWKREPYCRTQNKGKACRRVDSYACFDLTYRTSGEHMTLCTPTYGECDKLSDLVAAEPEAMDVSECSIRRYDPKWKPKK